MMMDSKLVQNVQFHLKKIKKIGKLVHLIYLL